MDKVTPASDAERRILKRVPAELKVEYKFDSTVSQGLTADISEGGIFLCTDKPALAGTKIYLRLQVKSGKPPIKVIGTVRRKVDPGESDKSGMGIKFEIIYAEDVTQMKNFVNEYLGISVPDSGISAVAGTKSFKHVMSPPASSRPGTEALPKTAGTAVRQPQKPGQAKPVKRRTPEEQDRRDLRKLDFSYDSWMAERVIKYVLIAAVPVALYFAAKWFMDLLGRIQ